MSQINIRNLSNENDDGSPEIVGVSSFSATTFFVPPKGTTAERPSDCEPGSIRFNTDTANLEYFRGKTLGWSHFELVTPNLGGGTGSNTGLGTRALCGGGRNPSSVDNIEFITVSTLGDAQDFGDLTDARNQLASSASRTRGIWAGGYSGFKDRIDFVTFSSLGDATDFGNLTQNRKDVSGCSSEIRGIYFGGRITPVNVNIIDYVTQSTSGNAVDFGDLLELKSNTTCYASSTRGVSHAGYGTPTSTNVIQFVTIATTGNAQDFGDAQVANYAEDGGFSNSIRGIKAGGTEGSGQTNTIDFVTIATTGNAQDFGDLNAPTANAGGASSPTRGVIMNGTSPNDSTNVNTIQFVQIMTTGNGQDFGDMQTTRSSPAGCSNGHGGL